MKTGHQFRLLNLALADRQTLQAVGRARKDLTMSDNLVLIKHLSALRDLARNVAGLSDEWLDHATKDRMRQLIHEYREQARDALEPTP